MAITIEFTAPRMGAVLYNPLRRTMRSRWDPRKLPVGVRFIDGFQIAQTTVVPGERMILDLAKRELRVYDPLASDQHRELLERLTVMGKRFGPNRSLKREQLTDDEIATHLHWIGVMLENGNAELVTGSDKLPREWKKGRVEVDFYNSSQRSDRKRFLDEFQPNVAIAAAGA